MPKRNASPTVVVEFEKFAVRAAYNSDGNTVVTRTNSMDPPCALAATQAGKLAALTCLLNGEGFDVFGSLCETHKRNIVWLIDDLTHDLLVTTELASALYCMPTKQGLDHVES